MIPTMKVERRVSSCSPSLVLLNGSKPAGSATPTNGTTKYYQFQLEPHHVIDNGGKGGQKVFVCDIDGCIFKRSFSLKRHYLRFHINFSFLSPRDINNCVSFFPTIFIKNMINILKYLLGHRYCKSAAA